MDIYKISLPLSIITHKRDKNNKFYLNLNHYRNAHYHTLDKAKKLFEELVSPLISHIPKIKKTDITYVLYTGSKTLVDLSNICSVVDKFFCDTLVNNNILTDDNIEVLSRIDYRFGHIDKENPRIEAILTNIEYEKEEPMRITLIETEMKAALEQYVMGQMAIKPGQEIVINFKAGRGDDGYTAEIDITPSKKNNFPAFNIQRQPENRQESVSEVQSTETTSELTEAFEAIPTAQETASEETPTPTGAPTSKSTSNSLFGNLTKPKN